MSEEMKNNTPEEDEDMVDVYTLTDDETGEEHQFELLAEADIDDAHYLALAPIDEEDSEEEEYVILRTEEEDGETVLYTVDDDETFDKVAEFFDDLFFNEVDCD